jgi:hypothetical protein
MAFGGVTIGAGHEPVRRAVRAPARALMLVENS